MDSFSRRVRFCHQKPAQVALPRPKISKIAVIQRKITRIDVPYTVWHGESEFEVKIIEFLVPRPENQDFSIFFSIFLKVCRNELKKNLSCTEFYGEFESEVGFARNPQKNTNKSKKSCVFVCFFRSVFNVFESFRYFV